jgi:L-seryl-tRNA(Ser) seleniumtransferase
MGARPDADRHDAAATGLRALPSVHELAAALDAPHAVAVKAARQAIKEAREAVIDGRPGAGVEGVEGVAGRARELLAQLGQPSFRRVINATGVILHTNLGRAPLSATAREAVARAAEGYSNLELDLNTGERGSRQVHVEQLLTELSGAEAALVVNNGAGAVLLAASALAGPGRSIIVSRGQLVEIGGGFRIPEVIATSGAALTEVGTTNRTRLEDYERAVGADTGAIMRVHPSNFRTVGFVQEVSIEELCELGVPLIDDVGSGVLTEDPHTQGEPGIRRSVQAGAALVCCSGDKLLGGPQAGLIAGKHAAVAAARAHPLARALRIDKLSLAALEATLMSYRDPTEQLPVHQMLAAEESVLEARATSLADRIGRAATVTRATGKVGGGALPLLELEGPVIALSGGHSLAEKLRGGDPPVIARVQDGRVLLDPRTLADDELPVVAEAVRAALATP